MLAPRLLVCSLLLGSASFALADRPPKPIKKPPTAWKMGGTSVSLIPDEEHVKAALVAAVEPKGWKVNVVSMSTACVWDGSFSEVSRGEEKYEVFFKRPWAKPDEACNPKDAHGPADSFYDEPTTTRDYDKKAEVVVWVAPKLGLYGKKETPEQKAKMTAEAKVLFAEIFKK